MKTTITAKKDHELNLFKVGNTVTDGSIVVMITETAAEKDIVFSGTVIHEDDSRLFVGQININFMKSEFVQFEGSINFEL